MALLLQQIHLCIVLIFLILPLVSAEDYSLVYTTSCEDTEYFDLAELQCKSCGLFLETSEDGLDCDCVAGYKLVSDTGAPSEKTCQACPDESMVTSDGWNCITCPVAYPLQPNGKCADCAAGDIPVEYSLDGVLQSEYSCTSCQDDTQPDEVCDTCERCHQSVIAVTDDDSCDCPEEQEAGGLCFESSDDLLEYRDGMYDIPYESYNDGNGLTSWYFEENYLAAESVCNSYLNLTSCQLLGNLCVFLDYNQNNRLYEDACYSYQSIAAQTDGFAHGIDGWPESMPWLYYSESADEVLEDTRISTVFTLSPDNENTYLKFVVGKYTINGDFVGYEDITGSTLQLCPDTKTNLDAAFLFGTTYSLSCSIPAQQFWDWPQYENYMYDMYIEFEENGVKYLHAIPLLLENYKDGDSRVNSGDDTSTWVLTRRFFMVDNLSGKITADTLAEVVRYASLFKFEIEIQGQNGKIYTPLLRIRYTEINRENSYESNALQGVSFEVEYSMDLSSYNEDVSIAMGVLSVLAVIWAAVRTNAWRRRAGMITIDIISMFKYFFFLCGTLADVFFIVMFGCGLYWLIFFREQSGVYLVLPNSDEESSFIAYISVAYVLKFFDLVHLIGSQCLVDIFFIDWERPKGRIVQSNEPGAENKGQIAPVSAWRMFFVANEFNEIQTTRKINVIFQLFMVILFLDVIGFEDLASTNPRAYVNTDEEYYTGDDSRILRFAVSSIVYLTIALCQWVFFTFIYERFVEDYLKNFVDLCSMGNVSIFIHLNRCYGFYIHGRSPHGKADTNMKEMQAQLKREEDNLVGQRGLLPNSEQQTFEMLVQLKLREQYDKIMQPLTAPQERGQRSGGRGSVDMERSLQAFQTMNKFLSAFLDHSLRDLDYIVKDKLLLERILDMEFFDPVDKGFFFNDDGHSFDGALFHGHESTLLVYDVLFFSVIDLIFQNYMLSAVLTYLMVVIYSKIRDAWGRSNLANKTLVDDRFLI